jgi:hypothetical protein
VGAASTERESLSSLNNEGFVLRVDGGGRWRHDTQHNDTRHNDTQHNNKNATLCISVVHAECGYAGCHSY